jgi:hypothetical protein
VRMLRMARVKKTNLHSLLPVRLLKFNLVDFCADSKLHNEWIRNEQQQQRSQTRSYQIVILCFHGRHGWEGEGIGRDCEATVERTKYLFRAMELAKQK